MESKKNINVSLKVKEIIFDVMNKTHLTGQSRMAEGTANFEAGAHMQASEDAEHSYQLRRSISNAFAHLKVELGEYLNEDASTTSNLILAAVDNVDLDDGEKLEFIQKAFKGLNFDGDENAKKILNATKNVESTPAIAASWAGFKLAYNESIDDVENEEYASIIKAAYNAANAVLALSFKLPSNFNNSACDSLGGGLHEYIVDRATYDWFSITNKADAEAYLAMAQASLETTKKALYKRERPTRPTY